MKKIALGLFVGLFALCLAVSVFAQGGTLEKIAKSGEFTIGTRDGAIPFGFIDKNNEHVGFSVDMAKEFHKALEKKLGKALKFTIKTTNPKPVSPWFRTARSTSNAGPPPTRWSGKRPLISRLRSS